MSRDRLDVELAQHERELSRIEREWELDAPKRRQAALDACMDVEALRKALQDEDLAGPLVALFIAYETGGDCKVQTERLRERIVEIYTEVTDS